MVSSHPIGSYSRNSLLNTCFTQGLRPLCLPCATTKLARSLLKAEGRPNGCRGRSRVAHRTFRHRHGRHGRCEVLSMFKTVEQRWPRRSVAHRSLKGSRMKAHTSSWSQNGCTVVGHWSPSKKCKHCVSIWATRLPSLYHHCASFCRPMASIERSLWRPLCLHSATTAHLSHHGNGSAFTLPSLRDLLCHYSSFGRSRKAQGSCCSSYTETEISGFRRPLSVLTIFMVAQRWHEGRNPV